MTLEQILKSKGWTDAELAEVQPMLTNPRFRADMEAQYGALAAEKDDVEKRWQERLDTQWQPRVNAVEREAQEARLQLAQAQEQLRIAKDYGYLTDEAQEKADAAAAAVKSTQDAAAAEKRYVTHDDIAKYADAEGQAIVMANDLSAEYSYLTGGKSLFEYENTVNGVTMRGLRALREEAKANRTNLETFVAQKFDFAGKRRDLTAKRQQEHDDSIRKDTEEKVRREMAEKFGNPLMRTATPSRVPFIPGKSSEGKQPWERSAQERRSTRIAHAMETQMKSGVQ